MILLAATLSPFLTDVIKVVYILLVIYTIARILLDTHSTAKTLAYLLLVIIIPIVGIILYYSVGINYRHKKTTKEGTARLKELIKDFKENIADETTALMQTHAAELDQYTELVKFVHQIGNENLSKNEFKLLINGEEKFPEVLTTLKTAKSFIHMEYYDWENDTRGNQIKDVLLQKIKEGVKVRVIYDDYASRKMKHNVVRELKQVVRRSIQ